MSTYQLPRYLSPEQAPRSIDRAERIEALIDNLANEFGSLTPAARKELWADLFDCCWKWLAAEDAKRDIPHLDTITLEPAESRYEHYLPDRAACAALGCPACRDLAHRVAVTLEPVTDGRPWCDIHNARYSCCCYGCQIWCGQCWPAGAS